MRLTTEFFLIAVLGGTLPPCFADTETQEGCHDLKTVRVEGKDSLPKEDLYRNVRNELLEQLLLEAVAIVNGTELASRERSELQVRDESLSEQYTGTTLMRLRGFVQSYSFPLDGEEIEESEIGPMLVLRLDVTVCDQSNLEDHIYVKVGVIHFPGFEQFTEHYLKEAIKSGVPKDSNIFVVEDSDPNQFFDFTITGKILSVAVTQEESAMKSLIGNVVKTGDGAPIVDSRVNRISAIIALKAQSTFDDSYTVVTETVEQKVNVKNVDGALARRVDEFVGEALQQVSGELFQKIQNQKDFKRYKTK